MNNKGYTLVELMMAIIIIGIIMGMSFPAIRKIQESNTNQKYTTYGESLVAAAKLYVDAYEEDLFLYEDDFDKMSLAELNNQMKNGTLLPDKSQCAFISYEDFKERMLIKDISINGITCYNKNTFVRVIRKDGKYSYKYYLACGKQTKKIQDTPISDSKVSFTWPDRYQISELTGQMYERCIED